MDDEATSPSSTESGPGGVEPGVSTEAGSGTPTVQSHTDPGGQDTGTPEANDTDVDTSQDIRFAVAMSGGVSLAVWMGGVARELNLLQQASNYRQNGAAAKSAKRPPADSATPPHGASDGSGTSDWDAQSRSLYAQLLELLDVKVTVDVLSGTSAGGINAALLGLSSAAGVDLAGLRDLWLTTGSMDALLRDPGEKNPTSLLQGDKVLFNGLNQGIKTLYTSRRKDPKRASSTPAAATTVFITTTMMSGETSRFTDDYGTLVPDVDHHGLFTFSQDDLAPREDKEPPLTALALAARSSASFPGAFEPSFVPVHSHVKARQGIPEHPNMASYANMTRSHWVADGGLLANRPLAPLLAQVFSQPAKDQVRRVLAFVVPDGGGTQKPAAQPVPDKWQEPATMAGALKEDLDAQLAQSIATDLEAVRTHNERLKARHYLRRYLADMGAQLPSDSSLVTARVLRAYQQQQGTGLAQPLLHEVMFRLTTMALPQKWAAELSASTEPVQTRMAAAMTDILGAGWHTAPHVGAPSSPTGQAPATSAEPAGEAAVGTGAARPLHVKEAAAWDAWGAADPFDRAAAFGLPVFHAARATAIHLVRLGYQRAASPGERAKMTRRRTAIENSYQEAPPSWDERGEAREVLDKAARTTPVPELTSVASELADAKRCALLIGPRTSTPADEVKADEARTAELRAAWRKLVRALIPLLRDLDQPVVPDGRRSRHEAASSISDYLHYFSSTPRPDALADRLLNLVIAERALQPAEPEVDQPVEFIQVSANTRTLLAPQDELDTVNKLRGVELHHFAAFYKSSWRAYDWMWGRMDASGWLVHILLDPRRILAVIEDRYATEDEAATADRDHPWAHGNRAKTFAGMLRETAGVRAGADGDCLEKDLAFLDDPDAPIPVSLPNSALFLAQAWQNLIAANELPTIAEQMIADSSRLPPLIDPRKPSTTSGNATDDQAGSAVTQGRAMWRKRASKHRQDQPLSTTPDPWTTEVLTMKHEQKGPADFAAKLPACPVRGETLAGQVHTPTFTRLAAKAAAVAAAAVASAPEIPGSLRPVLASARTVSRTGYQATKVTGGSGWKTLVAGAVLAVIGGVMATQGLIAVGLTGTVIALVGLYLIALGAWGIHRGLLTALVAITLLALAGSLTLAWVRTQIWGPAPKDAKGLVPQHVLPWLHNSWWGGLVLIGGVLLLAALISVLTRRRPPRNRSKQSLDAAPADHSQPAQPSPAVPLPADEPRGEAGKEKVYDPIA